MQAKIDKTGNKFWLVVVFLLLSFNLIIWVLVFEQKENNFTVSFYDVGQGDSALIQTPHGYNILVDGGPNNKVVTYLNKDLPLNNRELDAIILTHPQSDHMNGLIEVVKKFKVKQIFTTSVSNTTSEYKLWIDTVKNSGLKLSYLKASDSISLSDQVTIRVNWPEKTTEVKLADLNIASVVFSLTYHELDILMTGDADSQVQPYTNASNQVEVLKVPHHGSSTALGDQFIEEIKPKIAIISSGKGNRYGHPRSKTLEQLAKVGSEIVRTDQKGTIKIVSDGLKWYTQTEK